MGVIPKRNIFKFAQYAHNLQESGADMILLACSTFNYAAELARPMIDMPIMQIDRPMMEIAVCQGGSVGLLATLADHRAFFGAPAAHRGRRETKKTSRSPPYCGRRLCRAFRRATSKRTTRILMEEIDKLSRAWIRS